MEDFLVDEEGWRIRHVVVGRRGRHPAGEVLPDPWWIGRIASEARTAYVGLAGGQIWGTRRYAGYEVRDPLGVRIGTARETSADGDAEPGYIRFEAGFRTGILRPRTVVIPTQMVAVDGTRRTPTLQ